MRRISPTLVSTARRRRRKAGVFLNVLTCVLVAAAIYIILVKPMERLRPQAEATAKTCPECGSGIPLGSKRCPMCTGQLAD